MLAYALALRRAVLLWCKPVRAWGEIGKGILKSGVREGIETMTKRTIGYLIAACAFTLALLAGSVGFLASSTRAAAPPDIPRAQAPVPAGGVKPASAPAPNQVGKPAQPQAS